MTKKSDIDWDTCARLAVVVLGILIAIVVVYLNRFRPEVTCVDFTINGVRCIRCGVGGETPVSCDWNRK